MGPYMIYGHEIPDLVFDALRRSQRGRRGERWHCRGQVAAAAAAGGHFAEVAWPLAEAAGHLAGGERPGQAAGGEQVSGAGLQLEQGVWRVPLHQEPETMRVSIEQRCTCEECTVLHRRWEIQWRWHNAEDVVWYF